MQPKVDKAEEFMRMLMGIQNALRGYVYAHVHDTSLTADIVQDVSVVLWRKYDQYQPDRSFLKWAMGIARNEILHANRQSARSRVLFDDEMALKLANCYEEMEPELDDRRQALDACLERLSADAKHLIEMRYGQSMPLQEIADAVKKKLNAVTVAISRVRAALVECVDRYSHEIAGVPGGQR